MLTCPYCGEEAMSRLDKALLASHRSVPCKRCGKRVSVSWLSLAVQIPIVVCVMAGAVMCAINLASTTHKNVVLIVLMAGSLFGVVLTSFLLARWVPIVPREGPPVNRCRGCGYDVTGLEGGAVCPECGKMPTG